MDRNGVRDHVHRHASCCGAVEPRDPGRAINLVGGFGMVWKAQRSSVICEERLSTMLLDLPTLVEDGVR